MLLVDGLWQTLQMAFLSILFAIVFGLVFGVGKLSDQAWISWPSWLVVEFFRAVPVLLLMVFIFATYGIGDGFGAYWSVVFALTLYNGSVLAEVFRAGVNAVPSGQAEAAYAIGMRKTQVMRIVLLPQAIKIMLPSIISQMVVALKDTSLGYYIVAPGLTFVGKQIYGEFKNQLQTVIVVALIYILVNLLLTWVATWVQRRILGQTGGQATSLSPTRVGRYDERRLPADDHPRAPDCVFCAIVAGESPATVVDEDERTRDLHGHQPGHVGPRAGGAQGTRPRPARDPRRRPHRVRRRRSADGRAHGRPSRRRRGQPAQLLRRGGVADGLPLPPARGPPLCRRPHRDSLELPWTPTPGDPADIAAAARRISSSG